MDNFSLTQFLTLFQYNDIEITERFNEVKIGFTTSKPTRLKHIEFEAALNFLNPRDKLHLSFIVDGGDPIDFYSGANVTEFLVDVNGKIALLEDEEIKIIIKISKHNANGIISIYAYTEFLVFLKGLSLQAQLHEFNQYIQKVGYLIFEFQTKELITKTTSIWFVNKDYELLPQQIDRVTIINKAKTTCHYNYLAKFNLVAEDFIPLQTECKKIEGFLNKLVMISSIVFLYDISIIEDNILEYRLNGYKSISGKEDFSEIKIDAEYNYYKIYKWVYDSGNFNDKIGLARNIISLHLEQTNHTEMKGDPFFSIQSSYKVYEKQNIKQYIEIRNKISDQLLNFHDRANKIIETFASGFQKSAFALITFYISAIILKVLNKDKLIDVFTIDTAILSTTFIVCSLIYYFVSKWEVNAQKIRFKNNYANIKKRYTDLLDEQDISRILNDDHEFNSDVKFIEDKGEIYTIMWFLILFIFFFSTWLLYFIYNPILLLNTCGC